ncbi:hypothetical protein [Sphingobacterium endophyticum]|uniref:hypothetical protein n=1 Tax=Sphingobacterium endophyticum TaxID=2546448 RepID=UPI0012E24BF8|nr:hypothetical protein [Sphingobacterium endophyticum]
MKASEFVEGLKGISVRTDLLKKQGVSDQFIEGRKRSYLAAYKGGGSVSQYPLVELVENYDCSNLEIGMITFDERIEQKGRFIFFGRFEVDDLAVDLITGSVVMLECGLDHILYDCARNDSSFLDAILNAAIFLERRSGEEGLYENEELNIQRAEWFGDIAGGEKYYDFYKMMLGV